MNEVMLKTTPNWEGREVMRQRFLNQENFCNDLDEVDARFVRLTNSLEKILSTMINAAAGK